MKGMPNLLKVWFIFIVLITMTISSAQAVEYLGEFCWHIPGIAGGWSIELGVTHMGDEHYVVSGKKAQALLVGGEVPISGSAEIVDGKFLAQITSSGYVAPIMSGFFGTMEVDLTTLDAKLNVVQYTCSNGSCSFANPSEGDYTNYPCQ